ncbi:MAG: DUF2142 domain-containing protein [Solirubrobacteraceae bacterium]
MGRLEGRRSGVARIALGWALLAVAWAFGNAPFASQDEVQHYTRAAGVWNGSLVAQRVSRPPLAGVPPGQVDSYLATVGSARVPAGLAPPDARCFAGIATRPASCLSTRAPTSRAITGITNVATYPPLPYLVQGAALRPAADPLQAVFLGRLAGTVVAVALIAAALALLAAGAPSGLWPLGTLAATTPMVLFSAASLGGSGLEICAAIAFWVALLRLTRISDGPGAPRAAWALLGVAGATLALARSSGLLPLFLAVPLAVGLVGLRGALARLRAGGRAAAGALAAIVAGMLLSRLWEASQRAGTGSGSEIGLRGARGAVREGVSQSADVVVGAVGRFGYLEVGIPGVATWAWLACCGALLVVAALIASQRERCVLLVAVLVGSALPLALWLELVRWTGFGLQGRYLLPTFVALPLLAGELLTRHADRVPGRVRLALCAVLPGVLGAVQAVAWWWNARRMAVGTDGGLLFPGAAEWSPPAGWWPWIVLALLGSAALATGGLAELRRVASASESRRVATPAQGPIP